MKGFTPVGDKRIIIARIVTKYLVKAETLLPTRSIP